MKPIKMLGFAALAALMAMTFVGAGSAMAESTALCNTDPGEGEHEVCPSGHLVTHVHETTLPGSKARLLSNIVNVGCDVLFLGDVTSKNNLGAPLEILGNFTYTSCETESGTGCTVTEVSSDSKLKALKLGHELADVTYEYEVNFHCGSLINCIYDGTNLLGHGLGPLLASETNGETRIEEATVNKTGGSFCPKTAKLDVLTTSLSTTYIAESAESTGGAESTALCNTDPGEGEHEVCPSGHLVTHVHETTLPGSKARLLSNIVNVGCDVLFLGDVTSKNNLGAPLEILGNFTYTSCETESGTGCTVTEVSSDSKLKALKLGHELADVTYEYEVNFHCGSLINCIYDGTNLLGHGLGPLLASETNGETRIEEATVNKTGGSFCPKTAKLDVLTTSLSTTYIAE